MLRAALLTSALLLLLAFVWGNAGSNCMEAVHQWHRAKQQQRMRGDAADSLIITYAEYLSLTARDKGEINYHGRMYDIRFVHRLGADVLLCGHYDDFDAELFKVVDRFMDHSGTASKDVRHTALFVYNGILPAPVLLLVSRIEAEPAAHIVLNTGKSPSSFTDVLKAPPEHVTYC